MKETKTYAILERENDLLKQENTQLKSDLQKKDADLQKKDADLQKKDERIAWLEQRLFGSKKDRSKPFEGPGLFDEIEKRAIEEKQGQIANADKEIEQLREKHRAKAKQDARSNRPQKYQYHGLEERRGEPRLPEGITPADLVNYDIIGKDEIRILHREPAKVYVEVIELPKLRLKSERNAVNQHILQANRPTAVIGGNHVAADFLADLVVNKFVHHIPEYRQVKIYKSLGVDMPTSTINDWVHRVANRLYPLYEEQIDAILQSDYLQIDEVPCNIADRKGQPCRKGYVWQFRDMRKPSRGLYFYYHKGSRAGEIPRTQLRYFRGAVQTDGYRVYDYFESDPNIVLLGCMAHVRRKFVEAQSNHPLAGEMVELISKLYTVEEDLREREADTEEVKMTRERLSQPILDAMQIWMQQALKQCTPSDSLYKAIEYTVKLWTRLCRYVDDGHYQIDNNPVERGQRPVAMGRKNYLFSQSDDGATDNAVFYTLLESCEVVGVDPYKWLCYALESLTKETDDDHLEQLLPYNYKQSQAK